MYTIMMETLANGWVYPALKVRQEPQGPQELLLLVMDKFRLSILNHLLLII